MCVCVCARARARVCVCVCARARWHVFVRVYVCMHICTLESMCVHMHGSMCKANFKMFSRRGTLNKIKLLAVCWGWGGGEGGVGQQFI